MNDASKFKDLLFEFLNDIFLECDCFFVYLFLDENLRKLSDKNGISIMGVLLGSSYVSWIDGNKTRKLFLAP